MTTATAELCGYRWHTRHGCAALPEAGVDGRHHCGRAPGHQHNPDSPLRPRHRCDCGATTTRKDER